MDIVIRRATPEDADQLIAVQDNAFLDDFETYGECPGYGKNLEKMLRAIEEAYTFTIMVDEKIIGDIIVRGNDCRYHLSCLCVIPEYEHRGIGQAAMRFLEKYFWDAAHWSLETPADKVRNHKFYKEFGFRITKKYRKSKVDIALFEKDC